MSKSIRIRTTPGSNKNIQVKVDQDFDLLEILSLKISQQDLYTSFCANYGVVVGRVIANKGFGVPNAKVSIFVPISGEDEKNALIRDLYPYKTILSKNSDNIRYNLLLSKATCKLNKAVGTFPTKKELLSSEVMIEIFDKYYKYTTTTNEAGDYMIFGVPTGQQTVHMDVDMSDAGVFSIRPYDLIDNGFSDKLFESRVEFKSSTNLDGLAQIKSQNKGIDVIPFWGDDEQCQIGITRVDFDTNFEFKPNAIFIGSIFSDQGKNAVNKRCNPRNDMGDQCELRTGPGIIEVIRVDEYTYDTSGKNIVPVTLENFVLPQGLNAIDDDGAFAVTIPMNLDHVITDEFGDLVPSYSKDIGVPTKSMARFKIKFEEPPEAPKRRTAQLIVPSLNRATGGQPIDQTQGGLNNSTENARWSDNLDIWKDNSGNIYPSFSKDFHTFNWNQIYSISQYLTRFHKGFNRFSYSGGVKGVDECGENMVFPFNGAMYRFDILYAIMVPFIRLFAALIKIIIILGNFKLCIAIRLKLGVTVAGTSYNIINACRQIKIQPFSFLTSINGGSIELPCSLGNITISFTCTDNCKDCSNLSGNGLKLVFDFYIPKCSNCPSLCSVDEWLCCAIYDLAVSRKVIRYTFHDAWLNGTAYLFQYKYKKRVKSNGVVKDKFCGPGGDKRGSDNYTTSGSSGLFGGGTPKCCSTRGINAPNCEKCLVRGPEPVDQNLSTTYHNNRYETGASDTGDAIYCPEMYPTKIINIGRTDACEDVIDRINSCINSTTCFLELFKYPTCPSGGGSIATCYTGTGYEKGYDNYQWVRQLPNSSYKNPAEVIIHHMLSNSCDLKKLFDTGEGCTEYELKGYVWKDVEKVSKVFIDMVLLPESYSPHTFQPGVSFQEDLDGTPETYVSGFETVTSEYNKFNPSGSYDGQLGQGAGTQSGTGYHFKDIPYFYFGLHNGKTAMDKLRKDFLVKE